MAKNSNGSQAVMTMISIFVLLNGVGLMARKYLEANGIDLNVVLTGNLILFLLSVFTVKRSLKAINNPNPHVFVRSFYAGFLIRLIVIGAAAFIYIYSKEGNVSKTTLFACLGIYALYSITEVSSLKKILKEKKNA